MNGDAVSFNENDVRDRLGARIGVLTVENAALTSAIEQQQISARDTEQALQERIRDLETELRTLREAAED